MKIIIEKECVNEKMGRKILIKYTSFSIPEISNFDCNYTLYNVNSKDLKSSYNLKGNGIYFDSSNKYINSNCIDSAKCDIEFTIYKSCFISSIELPNIDGLKLSQNNTDKNGIRIIVESDKSLSSDNKINEYEIVIKELGITIPISFDYRDYYIKSMKDKYSVSLIKGECIIKSIEISFHIPESVLLIINTDSSSIIPINKNITLYSNDYLSEFPYSIPLKICGSENENVKLNISSYSLKEEQTKSIEIPFDISIINEDKITVSIKCFDQISIINKIENNVGFRVELQSLRNNYVKQSDGELISLSIEKGDYSMIIIPKDNLKESIVSFHHLVKNNEELYTYLPYPNIIMNWYLNETKDNDEKESFYKISNTIEYSKSLEEAIIVVNPSIINIKEIEEKEIDRIEFVIRNIGKGKAYNIKHLLPKVIENYYFSCDENQIIPILYPSQSTIIEYKIRKLHENENIELYCDYYKIEYENEIIPSEISMRLPIIQNESCFDSIETSIPSYSKQIFNEAISLDKEINPINTPITYEEYINIDNFENLNDEKSTIRHIFHIEKEHLCKKMNVKCEEKQVNSDNILLISKEATNMLFDDYNRILSNYYSISDKRVGYFLNFESYKEINPIELFKLILSSSLYGKSKISITNHVNEISKIMINCIDSSERIIQFIENIITKRENINIRNLYDNLIDLSFSSCILKSECLSNYLFVVNIPYYLQYYLLKCDKYEYSDEFYSKLYEYISSSNDYPISTLTPSKEEDLLKLISEKSKNEVKVILDNLNKEISKILNPNSDISLLMKKLNDYVLHFMIDYNEKYPSTKSNYYYDLLIEKLSIKNHEINECGGIIPMIKDNPKNPNSYIISFSIFIPNIDKIPKIIPQISYSCHKEYDIELNLYKVNEEIISNIDDYIFESNRRYTFVYSFSTNEKIEENMKCEIKGSISLSETNEEKNDNYYIPFITKSIELKKEVYELEIKNFVLNINKEEYDSFTFPMKKKIIERIENIGEGKSPYIYVYLIKCYI